MPLISTSSSSDPLGLIVVAVDGAPRHEAFPIGGERARARLQAIGNDQQFVGGKQAGDFALVGLELIERAAQRGVFVGRVLEFDHAQRQAVDEDHDIGPPVAFILDDGKLIEDEPIIAIDLLEVDGPDFIARDRTVGSFEFHVEAIDQQLMPAPIVFDQVGRVVAEVEQAAQRFVEGVSGDVRIDARQRRP